MSTNLLTSTITPSVLPTAKIAVITGSPAARIERNRKTRITSAASKPTPSDGPPPPLVRLIGSPPSSTWSAAVSAFFAVSTTRTMSSYGRAFDSRSKATAA